MVVFSISLCLHADSTSPDKDALILASVYELSSFSYWTQSAAREMCTFAARTFVTRTSHGVRQSIEYQGHYCHVYVRGDGLSVVVITDKEYPSRVAYTLIGLVLNELENRVGDEWKGVKGDYEFQEKTPFLQKYIEKYQDPTDADHVEKINRELDMTKDVMVKNIDSVLKRGEAIDTLVDRSNDLHAQSKDFYKQARRLNSCCTIL